MRPLATGLVLLAAVATSACSDSDPAPAYDGVEPEYATAWMQQVTLVEKLNVERSTTFTPVTEDGRVYSGDPTQYEKVCGATFLIDGSTPELYGGIHGERPGANPDPTYYRWLQAEPKRWSAFNAWLDDPAIVDQLGDTPENVGKTRADRIGTTKDCPDADQAGVPAP